MFQCLFHKNNIRMRAISLVNLFLFSSLSQSLPVLDLPEFLDTVFIQGWQTYLVFYSIQSHYIDFKIPQMCFIISSCEIHAQMNPCSTNRIVQRRGYFIACLFAKSCFDYSIFITFWAENVGDPQEEEMLMKLNDSHFSGRKLFRMLY